MPPGRLWGLFASINQCDYHRLLSGEKKERLRSCQVCSLSMKFTCSIWSASLSWTARSKANLHPSSSSLPTEVSLTSEAPTTRDLTACLSISSTDFWSSQRLPTPRRKSDKSSRSDARRRTSKWPTKPRRLSLLSVRFKSYWTLLTLSFYCRWGNNTKIRHLAYHDLFLGSCQEKVLGSRHCWYKKGKK